MTTRGLLFRLSLLAAGVVSCSILAPGPEGFVGGQACSEPGSACIAGAGAQASGSSSGGADGGNAAGGKTTTSGTGGGGTSMTAGANQGGTLPTAGTTASGGDSGGGEGGGAGASADDPCGTSASPLGPDGEWALDFCDDFEGPLLDLTKWSVGFGWGNISNTVAGPISPEQVTVNDGYAVLGASTSGNTRKSSGINTHGAYEFTYGYVETRLRAARGSGLETLGWVYPVDFSYPPALAPVDVDGSPTELIPDLGPTIAAVTLITPTGQYIDNRTENAASPFTDELHTYGVLWAPTSVEMYVDGELVLFFPSTDVPDISMYLRLEVCNCPDSRYDSCPASLGPTYQPALVDYVRVWKAQ